MECCCAHRFRVRFIIVISHEPVKRTRLAAVKNGVVGANWAVFVGYLQLAVNIWS